MSEIRTFEIERRCSPLLISLPHVGTAIPAELRHFYTEEALALTDTDWHLDRLYAFAASLGATVIRANVSRYVIDLNRPATGESLYPGMITTTLCPDESFRGEPLYRDGCAPDSIEVARRIDTIWRPYHSTLRDEIQRLRNSYPHVLVWDAHSIASTLPRLFAGKLPDFNFGTSDGQSCHEEISLGAIARIDGGPRSWVLNGRFKGGFITRRYGSPTDGVHTLQLELCQSLYMDELAPFAWRSDLADQVAPLVQSCVEGAVERLERLPPSRSCWIDRCDQG